MRQGASGGGNADTSGNVSIRLSHLLVIPLVAIKRWKIRTLDGKNVMQRADGSGRDVFLRSPTEWDPSNAQRTRKLHAPGCALNDAPDDFHRSPRKYLRHSVDSLLRVGLRLRVSSFDPRVYFVFRKQGGAVGATGTRVDDILGCCEQDVLA